MWYALSRLWQKCSRGERSNATQSRRTRLRLELLEDRLVPAVSAQEQLFVYMLNRARHDPAAYQQEQSLSVDLSGVAPQPPLAVNNALFDSSEFHASDMATRNYFAHNTPQGLTPNQMVTNAGYDLDDSLFSATGNNVESIAAGTVIDTAAESLNLLIVDAGVSPPGHRIHLLAMSSYFAAHREIGVGHAYSSTAAYRNYWAIHTARSSSTDKFLTGVVFNDLNSNGRYDLNEGLAGVTVSTSAGATTTNAAGGWSIKVTGTPTLTVMASGGGYTGTGTSTVTVGSNNIEVDFISGQAEGIVNFETGSSGGTATNSAPVLNTSGNPALATINEDTIAPAGTSLSTLIGAAIWDADAANGKGVAIIGATGSGTWQYASSGTNWVSFGSISSSQALLLPMNYSVRFVPAADFSGTANFTLRAWDQTSGSAGSRVDLADSASVGGTTAFSSATETASVTVVSINDAPVLTPGTPMLPTVAVNSINPAGVSVNALVGGFISDADPVAVKGIAVVALGSTTKGTWQFSTDGGATFTNFVSASSTKARLLDADDLIRFVPKANFTMTTAKSTLPSITYRAWDQTTGTAGAVVGISSSGKATAFSATTQVAKVRVNSAPVLTPRAAVLGTTSTTFTTTVSALLGTSVQDVGTGTLKGIAVTELTTTAGGKWQYSINGGRSYIDFGSVSPTSARLLRVTDRIRYVPAAGSSGMATITFQAWDQTFGAAGQLLDITGLDAVSTAQDTATLNVI